MEWLFAITAILTILLCALVFTDKIIFDKKLQKIDPGMTGKQIQAAANVKIKVIRIESNMYYAKISSPLTIFNYQLTFRDGRLLQKNRI